jgi:adenylate kinase
MATKYKTFLLFGAPGSGKGTQGQVIGKIPGFFHCACGDVFRSLDLNSDLGKAFLKHSSKGELVPDELTIQLWQNQIDINVKTKRFDPEHTYLVLDGIPRNVNQAKIMADKLDVIRVFHLTCPDRKKLYERLKRRALKDNRFDDANEEVIKKRLDIYEKESRPVLDFYGPKLLVKIDATQTPIKVLDDILRVMLENHADGAQ